MRCPVACMLLLSASAASAATWVRVSSPSVEILTDSGEGRARAILKRLDMLRRVFRESYTADSPVPLRVFLFAGEGEYRKYRPDPGSAGFYQPDQDRDFIVLYEATALRRNASHEYLHMVMNHSGIKLPPWMEEGVPEFYSTISIDAAKMHIGEPIEPHRNLLTTEPWLTAEDLALGSAFDGPIFYAESWALVHMLTLSPAWSDGMPRFVKLLTEGQSQDEAFRAAFGKSLEDAIAALRVYVRNMKDLTEAAPPAEEIVTPSVTRLNPVDATLALADLALRTEHRSLAFSLFSRAAKNDPQSPSAVAGLGELALAEDRKDDAQREFERAIAMGLRDAGTYFQLAMLKNDDALLEKAVALDPNFADAQFLLGVRATDRGDFAPAIDHLRRAVAIRPRRFTYWHALGYAQAKSGDRPGAAESARRAAQIASTDQEEQMAASLTQLASDALPSPRTKRRPDVITPPAWQNRKGDTSVNGTLKRVDCAASPVRLLISSPAKEIELVVKDPNGVELLNGEGVSTTLVCGEQSLPISAEYFAATMEIIRIEFKHVAIMKR